MGKIGVGIITCNRQDFYERCLYSLNDCELDAIVTVNDGDPYEDLKIKSDVYFQHEHNKGVGITKNEALQHLMDQDCDHIFLIEDDIIVLNTNVFTEYINAAKASGIWHMMYGYHGPANKNSVSKLPLPRMIMDYTNGVKVAFNTHCVGAFCYYHKNVLDHVGLMDETYKNAWEHVDHSLQIVKAGLLPGYWWWPDLPNSYDYLMEQACSEESSVIRWEDAEKKIPKKEWADNIQKGAEYFIKKNNFAPGEIPDTDEEEIVSRVNLIKERYSRSEIRS
jgi:GT2 family glycosyltransferase